MGVRNARAPPVRPAAQRFFAGVIGLTLVFDIPSVMPDEAPALTRMMAEQYRQVGVTVKVVEHGDRADSSETVRDEKINDACGFDTRWIFFASASRPFGMVSLSPDTKLDGDWGAGYVYVEPCIRAFSHIHRLQWRRRPGPDGRARHHPRPPAQHGVRRGAG